MYPTARFDRNRLGKGEILLSVSYRPFPRFPFQCFSLSVFLVSALVFKMLYFFFRVVITKE